MLENANFDCVSRKKLLKYHNFWRRPPLISQLRGTRPRPSAFGDREEHDVGYVAILTGFVHGVDLSGVVYVRH